MPDIELKRLRKLRSRAEVLLNSLVSDLTPFLHDQEAHGFRRKPDSESFPNDVNVTTTCSCLMALALSEKLRDFYGQDWVKTVTETFDELLKAPWMSSGLTEDNAFTTTLMIRLFGFLVEAEVLPRRAANQKTKRWEPQITFVNFRSFARKLTKRKEPFVRFLFELFTQSTQEALNSFVATGSSRQEVERQLAADLTKLIRTTVFDDDVRFKSLPASSVASKLRTHTSAGGYHVAQLNRVLLHEFFGKYIKPLNDKSLKDIALDMSSDPNRFGINEYPPAAAVLYWFVDGVARAQIRLPKKDWTQLCKFGAEEFGRQRSLVVAKHAAMMDPVAMAMSACLCARLRTISKELQLGTTKGHDAILPSTVELESSVVDLFDERTGSGIWPKYFPLFHYQDAGSNFCFTFELLEAVLVEFGGKQNQLLAEEGVIAGLEQAVVWCNSNRLRCSEKNSRSPGPYEGWNSGGNLETLRRGQPESWATAVVHMFLRELIDVLSRHIQKRLLDTYSARLPSAKSKSFDKLLDIELWLDERHRSLKTTLTNTIVRTFRMFKGEKAQRLRTKPVTKRPLSALLFGPPGTSKTEIAKAVAAVLDWPLVEIDPSHFLQDGFQNIYVQAERIFEDVMDLCGVVVLFDEMDALVQKRDAEKAIGIESKFLTTYMLPKLARLHDRGQLVFLMATNFQASFDDAIKRAGRFDFLLCIGPPTLRAKCESIHRFFDAEQNDETTAAGQLILKYASTDPWLEDQLSLYTYGECVSFISEHFVVSAIGTQVKDLGGDGFRKLVKKDIHNVSLRMDDVAELLKVFRLKRLRDLDAATFDETHLKDKKMHTNNAAIKYMLDKKQSRRQYPKSTAKA